MHSNLYLTKLQIDAQQGRLLEQVSPRIDGATRESRRSGRFRQLLSRRTTTRIWLHREPLAPSAPLDAFDPAI